MSGFHVKGPWVVITMAMVGLACMMASGAMNAANQEREIESLKEKESEIAADVLKIKEFDKRSVQIDEILASHAGGSKDSAKLASEIEKVLNVSTSTRH